MTYQSEKLSSTTKDKIRSVLNGIKENTPNFRNRPSQLKLIAEVSRTLSGVYGNKKIIVAEAPTGTGKSIGYMVASIPISLELGLKIVISTGTVALQEQLVDRDIPSLIKKSGLNFSYELAKGRGRYMCPRNLNALVNEDTAQEGIDFGDGVMAASTWPFEPSKSQRELVYELYSESNKLKWNGDLDSWPGDPIDNDLKRLITTTSSACTNRSCPYISECPFQNARNRLSNADVIVANHDLVMADVIGLGGGSILTSPDETIYIFDEAHHLPDVALSHGELIFPFKKVIEELKRAPNIVGFSLGLLKIPPERINETKNQIIDGAMEVSENIKRVNEYISRQVASIEPIELANGNLSRTLRYKNGASDRSLFDVANTFSEYFFKQKKELSKLADSLKEAVKNKALKNDDISDATKELSVLIDSFENNALVWRNFTSIDHPAKPPFARWFTESDRSGKKSLVLNVSPTSAGDLLRDNLWDRAASVVLASATVSSLGNFKHFAERAGLSLNDGTQYLKLSSPFNYEDNAVLHIPKMDAEPGQQDLHTKEVAKYLNSLIVPSQGSLVLFSSRKQMENVFGLIKPSLSSKTLMQGKFSKNEILAMHEDKIKKGEGSIIFGLASFSEGVDMPGNLCEQVFIAKLPFSVPDSPIDATYSEWLESNRRNPFMEVSVPDACIKLVQSCGRLIRTESDKGRVVLLDKRLLTKKYGKLMLDSLPPFKRDF